MVYKQSQLVTPLFKIYNMIKVDGLERKPFDKTGIFPFTFIKANTRKNETIIFDHSTDFMDHLTKIFMEIYAQASWQQRPRSCRLYSDVFQLHALLKPPRLNKS